MNLPGHIIIYCRYRGINYYSLILTELKPGSYFGKYLIRLQMLLKNIKVIIIATLKSSIINK